MRKIQTIFGKAATLKTIKNVYRKILKAAMVCQTTANEKRKN